MKLTDYEFQLLKKLVRCIAQADNSNPDVGWGLMPEEVVDRALEEEGKTMISVQQETELIEEARKVLR